MNLVLKPAPLGRVAEGRVGFEQIDITNTTKEGDSVVELDQTKVLLNSWSKPLQEVRDSL